MPSNRKSRSTSLTTRFRRTSHRTCWSACFAFCRKPSATQVKHSGARLFEVKLYREVDAVGLRVSDRGVGFDPELTLKTMNQSGLGLVSMRERLRLVQGTFSIESKPNGGTTIDARVPLGRSDSAAAR